METKDKIKSMIKEAALTQDGFAAKYGIPRNTVHNWCQGVNQPPEYLLSLLKKDLSAEAISTPMAWAFTWYSDKRGYGESRLYKTQQEAEKAAQEAWDALTAEEQRTMKEDPAADFSVGFYRILWDQEAEEWDPDLETGALVISWDAI